MDSEKALRQEIAVLEQELLRKRKALTALLGQENVEDTSNRFVNKPPLAAIKMYLKDKGVPCSRKELIEALVAGGNIRYKKRGTTNIEVGINLSLESGKLVLVDGLIGLPEWKDQLLLRRQEDTAQARAPENL